MNDTAGRGLPAPVPRDRRRVVIEDVSPVVDGGRFPVKRAAGEPLDVDALVFADGDDDLRVLLRHRLIAAGAAETAWSTLPMRRLEGDRWGARIVPDAVGYAEYAVVAWVDQFATWRRRLRRASDQHESVTSELLEGAELVRRAANAARAGLGGRPSPSREAASERLLDWSAELRAPSPIEDRVQIALSDELADDMAAWSPAAFPVTHVPLRARIERPLAASAAWLAWPSPSADPIEAAEEAAATTDEWLTRAVELGFDVVVLPRFEDGAPPTPEPRALAHPLIGTMADVSRLITQASAAGLDVAIDFACHGSLHHPYVTDHPEWFRRMPDGTMKRARTPPGDATPRLPFDFDGEAWESLWEELRRVVLFWVAAGVRTFRMDRPDEKPLAFWEWLIAEVHRDHPAVVFVAGATTRPALAARLAKIGFTQSEWTPGLPLAAADVRASIAPLVEAPACDALRLHVPAGVVPPALEAADDRDVAAADGEGAPADRDTATAIAADVGGRRLRLVLAATLGSAYRLEGGETDALDLAGPRGWPDLARRLNTLRRSHAAFRPGSRALLHDTDNPRLLCFSRVSADGRDRAIVVVNLNARHMEHGWVTIPAAAWGMEGPFTVTDELSGGQFTWKDGANYVRLEPTAEPAHVLTVG